MAISGGGTRLLPPNPFNAFTPLLLPVESQAIFAGAQTIIEATAPDVRTPLLDCARAIVVATDMRELPLGISAQRLEDYFQASAQMLGGDRARVLQRAAFALTRLVSTAGHPKGISALMAAGAGVMQGSVSIPSLWGGVGETVVVGGLATWSVPAEFWHRFEEIRSGQAADSTDARWVRNGLVDPLRASLWGIRPDNLPLSGAGFAIDVKMSPDEKDAVLTVQQEARSQFTDIDEERAMSILLGLKFVFGQFPWANLVRYEPIHVANETYNVLERLLVPYRGITVVLQVTAEDNWLVPPMEHVSAPPLQPDGKLSSKSPRGKSPALEAIREEFLRGVDWSNPVMDIAAKLGRATATNKRVIVLPPSLDESQLELTDGWQAFSLSTDQSDFHLMIANGDSPEDRFAVVVGKERPDTDYRGFDDSDGWTFVVGPKGNLGFLSVAAHVVKRGIPRSARRVSLVEYWPDVLAGLPFFPMFLGLRSRRHPLSAVYREIPFGKRLRLLFVGTS